MVNQQTHYLKKVEKLFSSGRSRSYPKNQLIHYAGDPLSQIYMIKHGFIKAYTILDSGDTRTILLMSAGDIFPLAFSANFDWQNYKIRYFYQSLSDTELAVSASSDFREQLDTNLDMMNTYMMYLAASNEAIMNQLEVMKNKKAIDKVALLLPYLISKAGKKIKTNTYQLQIKLSHQEIADLSGVTRETTTTLIKELEKDGVIDQHHGNWIINTKNLEKMHRG
jgi:CRP/FNR family cyclic AMP-dependent transcriptional regulator